jgi:hypothetical protein
MTTKWGGRFVEEKKQEPQLLAALSLAFSEGDGTRTRNHRIDSPLTPLPTSVSDNDLRQQPPPLTGPLLPDAGTDPDLARVVTAWPDLPPHVRAAVLALVQTSAPPPAAGTRPA